MQYDKLALNCEIISRTINLKLSIFKCFLIGPGNKNFYFHHICNDVVLQNMIASFYSFSKINSPRRWYMSWWDTLFWKNPICKAKIKLKCHFNISDIWSTIRKWSNYESRKNISVNLNWKPCLFNIIFWQTLFYHALVAVITLQFIL